ncbi:hypothetical protein [Paenibacillus apiarius]|uniref:Lipoprotein n=1 Tax=Paenibacillus apiarius TaxID=46240 RepID=A0ABT4DZB0_9BACL|nr:hypothetical protein [Paenibacillus apiarius]MCY9517848.1 hypothetical protein [Paenibacillus apiarius]MCY9522687.1 hypothetical protein [Paenibacillus apiarius]MCY9555372.1 hypothetical protein [Paenibacillus apiarius]MCY9561252.1 hypothetical protein [Paenibacillus apiarius]MCY9686555.1 hypothetical protein [Paenibacillus apiarius]
MRKSFYIPFYILGLILLLVGCSTHTPEKTAGPAETETHQEQTSQPKEAETETHPEQTTEQPDTNRIPSGILESEIPKPKVRTGALDLKDIEVDGVKGKLLDAVMEQLKETKKNNEKKLEKLVHPNAVEGTETTFFNMTTSIKSVTKLKLNKERVSEVSEEFGLDKDNVAIVVVSMLDLDGQPADLNLIYEKTNHEWLLFRVD